MLGETLQLALVEDPGVDHAYKESLERAAAEPVDNALDGTAGDTLRGVGSAVDKGAAVNRVAKVTLFFKPTQNCTNRGVLKTAAKGFTQLLGGKWAAAPNDGKDGASELSKFRGIVIEWSVTRHSVTHCNTSMGKRCKIISRTPLAFRTRARDEQAVMSEGNQIARI
jgi:hypothetical protein